MVKMHWSEPLGASKALVCSVMCEVQQQQMPINFAAFVDSM